MTVGGFNLSLNKLGSASPYFAGIIAIILVSALSVFFHVNLIEITLMIIVLMSIYFLCSYVDKYDYFTGRKLQ
ncbi:MAG: hypothetical protein ACFFFK_03520 [Candidatus Thorarchaeota archaeon]